MIVRIGLALLVGTLAASDRAPANDSPRAEIEALEVRSVEEGLRVSFRVENAFTDEERERLESGIAVTFRHRVELLARRAFPLFPARVLGRTVVETTVQYDSLTRQYRMLERTERKGDPDPPAPREVARTTDSTADAVRFMIVLRDIPLPAPPPEAADRIVRVRVQSMLGRRYRLLIFPGTRTASAEQRLEAWP